MTQTHFRPWLAGVLAGSLLATAASAQVADYLPSFGNSAGFPGRASFFHDQASTYKADRPVALFPTSTGGYFLVNQTSANPNDFQNIGIVRMNASGVQLSIGVDPFDFYRVRAACQEPSGRVVVASSQLSGNELDTTLYRFLADGTKDNGFGAGVSAGADLYQETTQIICLDDNTVALLQTLRNTNPDTPGTFRVLRFQHTPPTSPTALTFPLPAGGFWDARSLVQVSNGRWVTVSVHDSNDSPLLIKAITGTSLPALGTTTDIDPNLCFANVVSIEAPKIVADGNRIHAFGRGGDMSGNAHLWRLTATVESNGALSGVQCASEVVRPVITGAGDFVVNDVALDSRGDVYVTGTRYAGLFGGGGFRQVLRRYVVNANGPLTWDTNFADGELSPSFQRNSGNTGPYSDDGLVLLFDGRAGYRMVMAGAAEWANGTGQFDPVDTDVSVTVFSNQGMFANGFE